MSRHNEQLYKAATEAINALFGDRSVSAQQTLENMQSLIGEIEIIIDALESDMHKADLQALESDEG